MTSPTAIIIIAILVSILTTGTGIFLTWWMSSTQKLIRSLKHGKKQIRKLEHSIATLVAKEKELYRKQNYD